MAELRISIAQAGIKFTGAELAIVKSVTPVKTGRLQRGWRLVNGDLINNVLYAEFVEFGTKFMKARKFVKDKAMGPLLRSVTRRLLMATALGRKLVSAVTLQVKRAGSAVAVYRKTINPKFYRHLLRGVAAERAARSEAS